MALISTRPVVLSGEQHEEWLLDDAIDDTFPASDPVSHGQPGSIVNLRYKAREVPTPRPLRSMRSAPWLLMVSCVVAACAWMLVRQRERQHE